MAGRYNRWLRQKLGTRIRANGGYSRHNEESKPLSWTVHYFQQLETPEQAAPLIAGEYYLNMADFVLHHPDFDERFAEQSKTEMWTYAQERLVDDLVDDEGLRMWSPQTADRYGFDYKGEGAERPFDMSLQNYGRGGKHVCLTRFDCETLEGMSSEDFAESIEQHLDPDVNYGRGFTNGWCRKLMGILDELDEALTEENAARCGAYYEADLLARELGLFD
jgi:hypothetical protein